MVRELCVTLHNREKNSKIQDLHKFTHSNSSLKTLNVIILKHALRSKTAEPRRLRCLKMKGEWFSLERALTGWRNKGQLKPFLKQRESVCECVCCVSEPDKGEVCFNWPCCGCPLQRIRLRNSSKQSKISMGSRTLSTQIECLNTVTIAAHSYF